MDTTEKKKSRDFNIYYLNFSKVYEIAMMINNVILTKIETDKSSSFEEQYGFTSSISAQGTKQFLDGIKASISADARETSTSSSKVVESLDVKTTKSIPTELQTRFDLVCEFEEPTMAEKTAFLDLLLEMAKTKYSEQFAEIEMTEDEKKQLYAFDYSSLSALRDIKRVFNNRLMDYFAEKGVLR